MGKIATIEYFRVPPRWLFVKITDTDGNFGWGEASLEGHTQAVEGCLDAWAERYVGLEAEYVVFLNGLILVPSQHIHISTPAKIEENDED
jgi:L-alanine-DL-glutamate epimerase-like enolase superfamily enzyme